MAAQGPKQPIGVFDSGVGGLSVLLPLRRLLPAEDVVYVADQAWCPYGPKPPQLIRDRSYAIVEALLARGAKLIVVACNAASTAALSALRERYPAVPFVGMEPAVKPAAERTNTGHVGILATAMTARGERLAQLIDRFGRGVTVHVTVPHGLVELVEQGLGESDVTAALLAPTLHEWHEAGVDAVVLGCTHYPFARGVIERLAGSQITVIDPGPAVARQTQRVLDETGLTRPVAPSPSAPEGATTFLTTAEPAELRIAVRRLAGAALADSAAFGYLDLA
ncbi:MAG: Glutamate racemase [uncultured Chloroflexi bacterium]|uniref:Glutamate racemase n=1 Tax=uncultured Chloroflexota bacterium TaxID=166587 RepID=A0A6J4HU26_9CHLR|nr:MAG: Glutamate racemase [uncultured Chloroflexota bacterium]